MTLRTRRDFLDAPVAAPDGTNIVQVNSMLAHLASQTDLLIDIRTELLKQNAPVLTKTIVANAGPSQTLISDTLQHEVFFEIGGRSVTICKVKLWSTYATTVYYSFQQMANPLDGIPIVAGNFLTDDSEARTVYIWAPELAHSSLPINGNATTADGSFSLYGWTIPEYAAKGY